MISQLMNSRRELTQFSSLKDKGTTSRYLGLMQQQQTSDKVVENMDSDSPLVPGDIHEFDHVTFWVGNAKQAALYYINLFGFEPFAFRGLETGFRAEACHVVKLNGAIMQFVSATEPNDEVHSAFLKSHGDAVKDVAFRVTNIEQVVQNALNNGATLIKPITVSNFHNDYNEDECKENFKSGNNQSVKKNSSNKQMNQNYYVKQATINAFGDVTHTFIERNYEYNEEVFLPSYTKPSLRRPAIHCALSGMHILKPDHIVGQFPPDKLDEMEKFYCSAMNFKRFWSVDEKQIVTEHSGVKSHVVANYNQSIMMPLCEVLLSKKAKSKAEEFVRYNNGPGIHHIALLTDDIVATVQNMRDRGADFLQTPDAYYTQLKERLARDCPFDLHEDIEKLRELKILVDFDEKGYLLQIFTRPISDKPTIVFELIQRFNHNGFGAGNFLALFKAIEAEQLLRGNL